MQLWDEALFVEQPGDATQCKMTETAALLSLWEMTIQQRRSKANGLPIKANILLCCGYATSGCGRLVLSNCSQRVFRSPGCNSPLQVIGDSGTVETLDGEALAILLQAQLTQIQQELETAQKSLVATSSFTATGSTT